MPNTFPFYDAEPYWPKGSYGHHGGEGDSSGAATTDFYVFVDSLDTATTVLLFITDSGDMTPLGSDLIPSDLIPIEYEPMTIENETKTLYCYHYKNCPVGAQIFCHINGYNEATPVLYYSQELAPNYSYRGLAPNYSDRSLAKKYSNPIFCPRPLDGWYIVGSLLSGEGEQK